MQKNSLGIKKIKLKHCVIFVILYGSECLTFSTQTEKPGETDTLVYRRIMRIPLTDEVLKRKQTERNLLLKITTIQFKFLRH